MILLVPGVDLYSVIARKMNLILILRQQML